MIDVNSNWYKNCKRRRSEGAKICDSCPFKKEIENFELMLALEKHKKIDCT